MVIKNTVKFQFLSKIFKSEPKLDPINLSVFGADIH